MQEMLEWTRKTLPMDLDTPRMIEDKIESLLEKEKNEIIDFAYGCVQHISREDIEHHYNQTYNKK